MVMVDWISATVYFPHSTPINGGNVVSVNPDGDVDWTTQKWLPVKGSFTSSVRIRSRHVHGECSHISFSGNPVKFLQGHNVFGSSSVHGLLSEALFKALKIIGFNDRVPPYPPLLMEVSEITRIDLTASYHLENARQVNNWLRSAEFSANLRHRGKGNFTNGTLYFGKHSRRWSLKFYHKGQEVKDNKKHHIPLPDEILLFAEKSLRCELTLRAKELEKMGLSGVQFWSDETPEDVYNRFCSRLEMTDNMKAFTDEKIRELPPRLVGVYTLWKEGNDLREIYPRRTFYRYRKQLKDALSIDISVKQSPEIDRSNVIPLIQVLEAKPAEIPHWAVGTDFYFEPRANVPWGTLNNVYRA